MSIETNGRQALVLGYGRSGRAAASFIAGRGGLVRVIDRADTPELRADLERAGITARLGGYDAEDLKGADLLVVSPGVAWDEPLVEAARLIVATLVDQFVGVAGE